MIRLLISVFAVAIVALAAVTYSKYAGQGYVYLLFAIVCNALLFLGFRKKAIFFDAFIGVFLWLGFWLKLSARIAFADGLVFDMLGSFDGSGAAYDRALLVSSCGMAGLLAASFLRERFFSYSGSPREPAQSGLLNFYRRHRMAVVLVFLTVTSFVAASNELLGIYQRGMVAQTVLPYGLNGVYKWLLQFGLASVSALIIRFEIEIARNATWMAAFPALIEGFLSNVSLLSRGMILNVGALFFGAYVSLRAQKLRLNPAVVLISGFAFVVLFAASVYAVNYLRSASIDAANILPSGSRNDPGGMTNALLIDRWVGIEGVMAVSTSPKLGWDLWREAWREKYSEHATSFYDLNLIDSPYSGLDMSRHHFITLPGVIAFCFYPGSYLFLFGCLFFLGAFAAAIEAAAFRLGGANLILCSLMAQVVAYRYASFGYVPAQSYLLFGTLFLNLVIIYCADRALILAQSRAARV